MTNKLSKKIRRTTIALFVLNFLLTSSAFGQMIPVEIVADDPEIYPFAQPVSVERAVGYTEDLYEITDEGILDSDGNFVEISLEDEEDEGATGESSILDVQEELDRVQVDYQSSFEAYRESIITNWGGKKAFTEHRLKGIHEDLEKEEDRFEDLKVSIEDYEERLAPLHQKIQTLKSHIDLLNGQLINSKKKIQNAELQIAEKQINLTDLMRDLKRSEVEMNIQREVVLDYINLVYQEEEKFLDYYDESSSTLKLLLADNSVSENLFGYEYSKVLEKAGRDVFYDLHTKKQILDGKRKKIQDQQVKLNRLYASLDHERRILEEGRQTKKELLEETEGEEVEYQRLLDESLGQQLESAIAIQNLKDNISFIEQKLELLDDSLEQVEEFANDPDKTADLEKLENETDEVDEDLDEEFVGEPEEPIDDELYEDPIPKYQPFIWPVEPKAITSYFEDPTYPKRWGVHKAIDIRAKQFTEILAPANAYVFQAKDNGKGYSYIILAHKNNFITVYGHVTDLIAKPGTVVKQGEVIGLSGGTPGTKGAGWQTTGQHLHFEVWQKGKQVDPLDHLPVFELPIEYIPDKYLTD